MTETGFPFINMTEWFVSMRDTASVPLFPKTDSHWRYSAIYGYDSLFRFINSLDGEAKFPTLHIGPPIAYESDKLEGDEETLNLIFPIRGGRTKYKSEITVEDDSLHRKPKVLFVGDSFIWSMGEFMPARQIMADWEIWFYNNTATIASSNKTESVKDIDRLSRILNADYVVFYSAGHQWREATYGFTKDALLQLCVSDSLFEASVEDHTKRLRNYEGYANMTEEEVRNSITWMLKNDPELIPGLDGEGIPAIRSTKRIKEALTISHIRNDKDWVNALNFYAVQHAISPDDALREEARRISAGESPLREEIVIDTAAYIQMKKQEIIKGWRNNPDKLREMRQKASDNNQPLDTVFERNARWIINQQIEDGNLFQ